MNPKVSPACLCRATRQVLFWVLLLAGLIECRSVADCFPCPSGAVGWWAGDGTANDIAGTNHGTLKNNATAIGPGVSGQCFTFDGTNSYVQMADAPVLRPPTLTLECWVRFNSLDSSGFGGSPAGEQFIVFKQNTRSDEFEGYALTKERGNGDYFAFDVTSATGQHVEAQSVTLISTGVWYHVACVRGSNYVQIYVNGQLETQATVNFSQDYGTLPLYFGTSGQTWDHKLNGLLDEVTLYNRPLSAQEINAEYAAGAAAKCKAPRILAAIPGGAGYWGGSFTLLSTVTGALPMRYQWQFAGSPLSNATNSILTLSNLQPMNGGYYSFIVTNAYGVATSSTALVQIKVADVSMAAGAAQSLPSVSIAGLTGRTYGIQARSDLSTLGHWTGVTNIVSATPNFQWQDPNAAAYAQRFYRVLPGPLLVGEPRQAPWETSEIGAVVFDDFNRSTLGPNWTLMGGASATIVANELMLNSASLNYTHALYFQPWQTCSDHWTIRWTQRFGALDSNSRGAGVGIRNFQVFGGNDRGYNSLLCGVGPDLGKIQLQRFNGSVQVLVTSGLPMALSAGDRVDCAFTRSGWTISATATNRSNNQVSSASIVFSEAANLIAPTISRLCFYPLGGTVYVDDFSFTINHRKPARFIVIGASGEEGYSASSYEKGNVSVIQSNFTESVCNDSSSYNTTTNALSILPEIVAHQAGTAILVIGGNDLFFGVPANQWQAQYASLVTQLQNNGTRVRHCFIPRNTADLRPFHDWVLANFPASDIIDTWTPLVSGASSLNPSYDSGDGVHMNDAGHLLFGTIVRTNLP